MPARASPQRHPANRHANDAMRVSGSDGYASLFLLQLMHCNAVAGPTDRISEL